MVNKEEREAIAAEFGKAANNGAMPDVELPTIEQLKILANAATQGRWMACRMVHGERGDDLTADELGEYVKNCVAVGGERPFLFVSVEIEGRGVDLCHIGNGPNGPNNAAFIEAVNPATVLALIDHIEWLSARVQAGAASGEVCFSDNSDDIEANLRSDLENSCPHCGGSGHKDDVAPFDLQIWQATHMAYTRELEPAVELADFRQLMQGNVIVPKAALQEVIRISDRQHPAWDAVKAALAGEAL